VDCSTNTKPPLEDRVCAPHGLIYVYFGDKDGLFDAVADAYIDRIIDAVPIDADSALVTLEHEHRAGTKE
jgi:AcrR family transcriptional regulator